MNNLLILLNCRMKLIELNDAIRCKINSVCFENKAQLFMKRLYILELKNFL